MSLVQRLYCPSCGAPLEDIESRLVRCGYCDSSLLVDQRKVFEQPSESESEGPLSPPPSALISEEAARFELSLLEQTSGALTQDGFCTLALPEERFALIFMRLIDSDEMTLKADYGSHCGRLKESLSRHEDPGLAAFELLEYLCEVLPEVRLELVVLLFDPRFSSAVCYNAGGARSVYWVSGEEGRVIDAFRAYPALERKMLRMSKDHFSNSKPIYLAASDLVVGVSAAYAGRGGGPYADGTRALVQTLNEHLGQHPLKIVTLAKNAFWNERSPAAKERPLSGPLRVAAVRARPSEPVKEWPGATLEVLKGWEFEIVLNRTPEDHVERLPLHGEREVLLFFSGEDFELGEYERARAAVLEVLDRPNHGDNENPRRAGREGLEAAGVEGRCLVLLLINKYGRTKWYRHRWAQPLGLGPRGLSDAPSAQCFDEGGEATVESGARQFFPGSLSFAKPPANTGDLAGLWYGGKSSALYESLFSHWRRPEGENCLRSLLAAAAGDVPEVLLDGCCLVSRSSTG